MKHRDKQIFLQIIKNVIMGLVMQFYLETTVFYSMLRKDYK